MSIKNLYEKYREDYWELNKFSIVWNFDQLNSNQKRLFLEVHEKSRNLIPWCFSQKNFDLKIVKRRLSDPSSKRFWSHISSSSYERNLILTSEPNPREAVFFTDETLKNLKDSNYYINFSWLTNWGNLPSIKAEYAGYLYQKNSNDYVTGERLDMLNDTLTIIADQEIEPHYEFIKNKLDL